MRRLISHFFALFAILAFAGGAPAAGKLDPQTSSLSGVTVKVTPGSLAGAEWEFEVVFDTHSQELNDDPLKAAMLVAPRRALRIDIHAAHGVFDLGNRHRVFHSSSLLRWKSTPAGSAFP